MKTALVLGAGGFIGSHLVKRLKSDGFWVRGVDLKYPEHLETIADEFVIGDLRNSKFVSMILHFPEHLLENDKENSFDEVYNLATDAGGAEYIFTGKYDADILYNSMLINLNVVHKALKKSVKKIFYSSSACVYPNNESDINDLAFEESNAYPANPDSEYGWGKLFSERLYLAFNKNYGLNVRIARFQNIFGPYDVWKGGKEKVLAAMCRKVAETIDGGEIEVWGNGQQTRSFLYIDECIEAIIRFMRQDNFLGPVNIGSDELVSINQLAQMIIDVSDKNVKITNIEGDDFIKKYGYKCPIGAMGRKSNNKLYFEKMGWVVSKPLLDGIKETFNWINTQILMNLK